MPAPDTGWQVFTLRHGTRTTTRSEVFLAHGTYGEPDGPHVVDYYFWVLRRGERTVVVDTGYDAAVARRRDRVVLHDPLQMLADELGVAAEDVGTVVLTHCHYDHIGNAGRFPRAEFLLAGAELEFTRSGALQHALVGHFTEPAEVAVLEDLAAAGRLTTVHEEQELLPGVRLLPVGGHTPGQLMVEVDTADGVVLLASDAVHFLEEVERDMPFTSCMDLPATYRAFELVRAKLAGGVAHLVPGHDAAALDGMRRVADDVGVLG